MNAYVVVGVLLPLMGTTIGSACVFFMKNSREKIKDKRMTAFAAGVMTAASIWSLLIPAVDRSEDYGKLAFLPAVSGFWLGFLILIFLDYVVRNVNFCNVRKPGKTAMLVLAVALHNIPEGMAVGAIFAGLIAGVENVSVAGAFALSFGIAVQNLPEGAIISLPLNSAGWKKIRSFSYGFISGVTEPVFALITVAVSEFIIPVLPVMLSFAAGAMIYVVISELLSELRAKESVAFCSGFTLMMILDVALG